MLRGMKLRPSRRQSVPGSSAPRRRRRLLARLSPKRIALFLIEAAFPFPWGYPLCLLLAVHRAQLEPSAAERRAVRPTPEAPLVARPLALRGSPYWQQDSLREELER